MTDKSLERKRGPPLVVAYIAGDYHDHIFEFERF